MKTFFLGLWNVVKGFIFGVVLAIPVAVAVYVILHYSLVWKITAAVLCGLYIFVGSRIYYSVHAPNEDVSKLKSHLDTLSKGMNRVEDLLAKGKSDLDKFRSANA